VDGNTSLAADIKKLLAEQRHLESRLEGKKSALHAVGGDGVVSENLKGIVADLQSQVHAAQKSLDAKKKEIQQMKKHAKTLGATTSADMLETQKNLKSEARKHLVHLEHSLSTENRTLRTLKKTYTSNKKGLTAKKEYVESKIAELRKANSTLVVEASLGIAYNSTVALEREFCFAEFAGATYFLVFLFGVAVQCCTGGGSGNAFDLKLIMVAFLVFVTACIFVPLRGVTSTTCDFGLLWEYHVVFFTILMALKVWELLLYVSRNKLSFLKFVVKFNFSTLSASDLYTDVCFIAIAYQCGSVFWIVAVVVFCIGVACPQWCFAGGFYMAGYREWMDGRGTSDIVDRLCSWISKMTHFELLVESCTVTATGEYKEVETVEMINMFNMWAAIGRCVGEDTAQTIVQLLFVYFQDKANPQVVASIAFGFLSSCAHAAMMVMGL